MRKILVAALVIVLLVLPLVARPAYFYQGRVEKKDVPRPDLSAIEAPVPAMSPFEDRYTDTSPGAILVDLAHENRFEISELSVLQARLAARGQRLAALRQADDLAAGLRYAKALVIASPGKNFTAHEVQIIETFVDKGGRLLLLTDSTNFDIQLDIASETLEFVSDVHYINDLAAQFGLVFQPDYLYNTVENEGNFRNIKLTNLADDPLTEGLEQVVFYATHSILSEETVLIAADGETRSSNSERAAELATAVLAADGAVLALGDLTFMAEPHNAVYDNDRFIANIADFLSNAQRQYELSDFPFFFDDQVDLVYVGDPLLDSDLLAAGGRLQDYLEDQGQTLTIREAEDLAHDTLFLGLYAYTEEITPYLDASGVTFIITTTQALAGPGEALTATETISASPAASQPLTLTSGLTATTPITASPPLTVAPGVTATVSLTVTPGLTATAPAITPTTTVSPMAQSCVEIASLGQMVVTGTALLTLQTDEQRSIVLALAHTETGLDNALERLTEGNLQGCLFREMEASSITLALCPTGEVQAGQGLGGWRTPGQKPAPPSPTPAPTVPVTDTVAPQTPAGEPEGRVIIVSFDDGEGRYDSLTSAQDYEDILKQRFDVTVWSKARDGAFAMEDLSGYDLVIWTTGDFEDAVSEQDSEALLGIFFDSTPLIVSGGFTNETGPRAVQRDIQVADASHPAARGFELDQVISFVSAPSGSEYEIDVMDDDPGDEGTIVFTRGPESAETGAGAVYVMAEELSGIKIAMISFPLYLLPQEAKSKLVLNLVDWMLEE